MTIRHDTQAVLARDTKASRRAEALSDPPPGEYRYHVINPDVLSNFIDPAIVAAVATTLPNIAAHLQIPPDQIPPVRYVRGMDAGLKALARANMDIGATFVSAPMRGQFSEAGGRTRIDLNVDYLDCAETAVEVLAHELQHYKKWRLWGRSANRQVDECEAQAVGKKFAYQYRHGWR